MSADRATRVWNRATLEAGGREPRGGDKALSALLLAHSLIMNGGVHHALDVMSPAELRAAVEGFRFFRFDDVADLLTGPAPRLSEGVADRRYAAIIPEDKALATRFEDVFERSPSLFAPV